MAQSLIPAGYPARVRTKLKTQRERLRTRITEIVTRVPSRKASWLSFSLMWNGRHDLTVDVCLCDGSGNTVSQSRPYGRLIAFDAPVTEGNSRDAFRTEKPEMIRIVIDEIVAAWRAAKGSQYPLRADISITDMNQVLDHTSDVPADAKLFDLKTKAWVPDTLTLRRGQLNGELRQLIRPRLAQLQADLVQKMQKITRARVPSGATRLRLELHDVTTSFSVQLFAEDSAFSRTLLRDESLPDAGAIDWTYFSESGADVWHAMQDELIFLLAEAWAEAGGETYPLPVLAGVHDGGGDYDLKQRRWVVDFLGREIAPPEAAGT